MADAVRVADQGVEGIRNVLPSRFNWPLFGMALMLMSVPILEIVWTPRLLESKASIAPSANGSNRPQATA
jgi:hypothetical protein